MLTVKIASTQEELNAVYRLRYKIYIEEEAKFNKDFFPSGVMTDEFDKNPSTLNVLMLRDSNPIGTIRCTVFEHISEVCSADHYYDFSEIKKGLSAKYKSGRYAGLGLIAIVAEHRNRLSLQAMVRFLYEIMKEREIQYGVFILNHEVEKIITWLGADRVGEKFYSEEIRNYIVPMKVEMEKLALKIENLSADKNLI